MPPSTMPLAPDDPTHPPLDLPVLIQALERHHVEYLLVGGVAAQAHGAVSLLAVAFRSPGEGPFLRHAPLADEESGWLVARVVGWPREFTVVSLPLALRRRRSSDDGSCSLGLPEGLRGRGEAGAPRRSDP